MFLTKLELQGFKTFAKKTTLSFLPPAALPPPLTPPRAGGELRFPITSIVGPNGSGKSNLADAIRWVLGEQSLKLLRGKKSEDVIFSGSDGKGRSGFAQVSLTFNNQDKTMPLEYPEVVITRRLFRDGTSDYLLNEGSVRLADIQLLLAEANVGQRSYCVIGQGMIDHILVSSPEERKDFFDDATGVKPFQIKRHEALLKLTRTHENLTEVEMLLREIEPRLRSLKRQAVRLEQRGEIEKALHELESCYYGSQWWNLMDELETARQGFDEIEKKIKTERAELHTLEKESERAENFGTDEDTQLVGLKNQYKALGKKREALRSEQFSLEKEIELARARAQSNWAPLPLLKIVEEVEGMVEGLKGLRGLKGLEAILDGIESLLTRSQKLSKSLQRPNPEDIKPDPKMVEELKTKRTQEQNLVKEIDELEKTIDNYTSKERTARSELIGLQHSLREKQNQTHLLENERNTLQIALVRFEERQKALTREMDEFMKERAVGVRQEKIQNPKSKIQTDEAYPEIQRLRYKLELIGGIDPEIVKEYGETKDRFEFLDEQVKDLNAALASTEKIIKELDEQIEKQSKATFSKINKEFERYFKMLFGGGSCALVKLTREEVEETVEGGNSEQGTVNRERVNAEEKIVGIDIQATPPGKRLKALNLLSGGERALTSIALVSAIMAVNPAPFVVLDEVDAALDEANTIRFAAILEDLARTSQFIVITHNRATMEKADILYGVTMGTDGISSLLSVHLEEITQNGVARR
jgi:chromosome segregation protein